MQKLNKKYASVAQWIERRFPKPQVEGSTPFGGTIYLLNKGFLILCNPCN